MDRRFFLATTVSSGINLAASHSTANRFSGTAGEAIRVGMIGKDGHTATVLNSIVRMQNVQLVALAKGRPDDNLAALQKHKAFQPTTRSYETYIQMMDREKPDVVGICLPYAENAAASIEAARRGIHVISEKPAAATMEELQKLEAAIQSGGIHYTLMLGMRGLPRFQIARLAIQQGLVGEPILVSSQKSYKFGKERPWFYKQSKIYGGTIPWVGIHAIDFMKYVSGVDYLQVSALQGNKAHPGYSGCEDFAGVLFQLKNGGTAICQMDFLRPDSAPTHGDDRLRIAGSDGVLEVLDSQGQITLLSAKGGRLPENVPEAPDLFGSFIASIRGAGNPLVSAEEALHITRVCLKAREAAQKGAWIPL